MERSEEALRERVRETPLSERLKTCEKYVASMCAERRPPKMTIPLQHYDEDFYIYTTLADAQATIAALQARVKELEEITKVICGHCCEPMEIPSKAVLQSALTQRTAERDTARRRVDELEAREVDVVLLRDDLEQRTAELEAANIRADQAVKDRAAVLNVKSTDGLTSSEWIMRTATAERKAKDLQAELERVRGEHNSDV